MSRLVRSTIVASCAALLMGVELGVDVDAANKVRAKSARIYSTSNRSEDSQIMAISGVPACVTFANGTRRGLYVTRITGEGQWRQFGVYPGDVLLTIDRRVVSSGKALDSIMGNMPSGVKDFTFARAEDGGAPQLHHLRINYTHVALVGLNTPSSAASGGIAYTASGAAYNVPAKPAKNVKSVENEEAISVLEQYMFKLVNDDRQKNGVAPVSFNSALAELARFHATNMAKNGFFNHIDKEGRDAQARAREHGIAGGVYENISYQERYMLPDRDLVHNAEALMMGEPPDQRNHRYNILMPSHTQVGIGIARVGGRLMMVQEFAN